MPWFADSFIIPASLDMFPYVYLRNGLRTQPATVTKAFHRAGPSGKDFEAVDCLRDLLGKHANLFELRPNPRPRRQRRNPSFSTYPYKSAHPYRPCPGMEGKVQA